MSNEKRVLQMLKEGYTFYMPVGRSYVAKTLLLNDEGVPITQLHYGATAVPRGDGTFVDAWRVFTFDPEENRPIIVKHSDLTRRPYGTMWFEEPFSPVPGQECTDFYISPDMKFVYEFGPDITVTMDPPEPIVPLPVPWWAIERTINPDYAFKSDIPAILKEWADDQSSS